MKIDDTYYSRSQVFSTFAQMQKIEDNNYGSLKKELSLFNI